MSIEWGQRDAKTYRAADNFSGGDMVAMLDGSGRWIHADASNPVITTSTIAILEGDVSGEGERYGVLHGIVTNGAWSWTPGRKIYLDPTTPAHPVQTVPTLSEGEYPVCLGIALTGTTIHVSVSYDYDEAGEATISAGSIGTTELADGAVTTDKVSGDIATTDYVDTAVAGIDLSGYATTDYVDTAVASAGLPVWRVEVDVFSPLQSQVGTRTFVITAARAYGGYVQTIGNGNELVWPVVLSAGTWSITLLYEQHSVNAIWTFYLDGVQVGNTIDGYNAANTPNISGSTGSFNVATGGKKLLTIRNTGKNASSAAYYMMINHISLLRSA